MTWMTNLGVPFTLGQAEASEVLGAPSSGATGESGGQTGVVPGGAAPAGPAGGPAGGGFDLLLPLVFGLVLFMMVTSVLSGRKEKKKRAELLSSLKKRDRVQMLGGIIGTIVELKDDELVLKVDESSNTRIRFTRSAVQQVLKAARGPGEVEEASLENERYEDEAGVKA